VRLPNDPAVPPPGGEAGHEVVGAGVPCVAAEAADQEVAALDAGEGIGRRRRRPARRCRPALDRATSREDRAAVAERGAVALPGQHRPQGRHQAAVGRCRDGLRDLGADRRQPPARPAGPTS